MPVLANGQEWILPIICLKQDKTNANSVQQWISFFVGWGGTSS